MTAERAPRLPRLPAAGDASLVRRFFAYIIDLMTLGVAYLVISVPLWSLAPSLLLFPLDIAETKIIEVPGAEGEAPGRTVEVTYFSLSGKLATCRFRVIESGESAAGEELITRAKEPLEPCPYLERFDFGAVLGAVLILFYAPAMEGCRWHATVGKAALALQVRTAAGGEVGFPRAFARNFAEALCLLTLTGGYLIALFTRRRQALHDLITGTVVVER